MPLEPSTYLPAEPYVDRRPDPPAAADQTPIERHPYNALPTLRPRSWSYSYGPGTFGNALQLATSASDVVGLHRVGASMVIDTARADPQATLSYNYGRLPFDFGIQLFRTVNPRGGFRYSDQQPDYIEENIGITTSLGYALPTALDSQGFNLSYSIARFSGDLPLAQSPDPYALTESDPSRGYIGAIHLGWSYSNVERYLWGVGPEKGFSLAASTDIATPALASDYTLYVFGYSFTGYVLMPWLSHHSLAIHAGGSAAAGNYPRRGLFYTGGFVDTPFVDASIFDPQIFQTSSIFQGSFVLRGYAPLAFIGSQYHLLNLEYRFPIWNVDRGLSTLPVFLEHVSGNLFADYGGAFDDLDTIHWRDQFHLGVGGEVWIDMTLGYFVGATFRIGYAHGVADDAAIPGGKLYGVVSSPF
jgi:outer membrane protein assembly factor BamA